MSKKVKAQLASIRKEAARIETEKMRSHIVKRRKQLKELEADERRWRESRKQERRARLREIQRSAKKVRSTDTEVRRKQLRIIADKRKAFESWWKEVRAERARRLAEIAALRTELREWGKRAPQRRKAAVEAVTAEAHRQMLSFDAETAEQLDVFAEAVRRARAELRSDEYDLKMWGKNRRRDVQREKAVKPKAKERTEELVSAIEANLLTAEEWAWWRRERASVLRLAKTLGKDSGDEVAEMIREAVELNPERALDYLSQDSDAWVEAEVRKQGFAA